MRVLDEVPESELDLDYLAIRTPDLDEVVEPHPAEPVAARILVAARVGTTRLIDNLPLTLGGATLCRASAARPLVSSLLRDRTTTWSAASRRRSRAGRWTPTSW